jgi:hypothetical protein
MITKKIKDEETGKIHVVNFESEPTQQDLEDAFDSIKSQQQKQPEEKKPSLLERVSSTVFPEASKIPVTDLKSGVKANVTALSDLLNLPKRTMDFVTSAGGRIPGTGEAREAVKNALPENVVGQNLKTGVDFLTDPATYFGMGIGKKIAGKFFEGGAEKLISSRESGEKALESIKRGKSAQDAANLSTSIKPETGAGLPKITSASKIPDIEDLTVADKEKSLLGLSPKEAVKSVSSEAEKTSIAKPPKFSRASESEMNILSEPVGARDTEFTRYAVQARKSKSNVREMSAMDLAGTKGKQALDEISKMRSSYGKKKSALVEKNSGKTIQTDDIKKQWRSLLKERLGTSIDAEGNVIDATNYADQAGTRLMRRPSEAGLISQIDKQLSKLPDVATVKQADDIKSAIFDLVDNAKASMAKPINTATEAIGKEVRKMIDSKLDKLLGRRFNDLNTSYARLKNIETQLSKRLGEVTDASTGQTRMGASLMKSAIMSNSDRGSKALFSAIRKITGIDLIKDATFAKIAMDAVGDFRATDLLKSMAETKDLVADISQSQTAFAAATRVAMKGYEKVRGDKLDELIRLYQKAHQLPESKKGMSNTKKYLLGTAVGSGTGYAVAPEDRKLEGALAGAGAGLAGPGILKGIKSLGNKGEVLIGGKKLMPAVMSPETGKIYQASGGAFSHKSILNTQIAKQEPKAADALWNEFFKDNTGQYSKYIGFIDDKGNFIPRLEAEKAMENISSSGSLIRQFHGNAASAVLPSTAAASGAGLTGIAAMTAYQKKKKGKK